MQCGHYEDQYDLRLQPPGAIPPAIPGKPDAKQPCRDHSGVYDRLEQSAFHDLEGLGLDAALFCDAVINEQPGQVQHARHPGDYRNDVKGFYPVVHSTTPHPYEHLLDVRNGGIGQNSMAQVEDEWTTRESLKNGIDSPIQSRAARQ